MPPHSRQFSRKFFRRCGAGFTLIELLVTVLIIGILAAILVPGYRMVRTASMGARNMANHRAIATALLAYSQEFQGRLPWANDTDPPFGDGASSLPNGYSPYPKTLVWLGYLDDPRVFFSPMFWPRWGNTESASLIIKNPTNYPSVIVPWAYTNYGVNRYGAMPERPDGGRQPANLLRVAGDGNLGKLMLVRDTYQPAYDRAPNYLRGGGTYWFVKSGSIPNEEDTYGGLVHASFADGHVEGFKRQTLIDLMTNSGGDAPLFNNIYTFGN